MLTKASIMVTYAREAALSDQEFWKVVSELLRRAGRPNDFEDKRRIKAIYDYMLGFDFVVAPPIVTQYLLRPLALDARKLGDCTAFATFICAAAAVMGYRSKLIFMSASEDGEWDHVWARVYFPARTDREYFDVDPAYRKDDARFGWSYPESQITRMLEVEVM